MEKQTYSVKKKQKAVALLTSGVSAPVIAKRLKIVEPNLIYKWRNGEGMKKANGTAYKAPRRKHRRKANGAQPAFEPPAIIEPPAAPALPEGAHAPGFSFTTSADDPRFAIVSLTEGTVLIEQALALVGILNPAALGRRTHR